MTSRIVWLISLSTLAGIFLSWALATERMEYRLAFASLAFVAALGALSRSGQEGEG